MSLLAEVVVEEWLNRQGYFTIRGVKLGIDEIDILAIRPLPDGSIEHRHIEVQASFKPMSYITPLPKAVRKDLGQVTSAKKRSPELLSQAVQEWVYKKYHKPNKKKLFEALGDGWSKELVLHNVMHQDEIELIRSHGIEILRLGDIVKALRSDKTLIKKASGSDLLELMYLASAGDSTVAKVVEAATDVET